MNIPLLLSDGTVALVDLEFLPLLEYNWTAVQRDGNTYAARRGEDGTPIYLHHVVLPDCPEGFVRDHINGDGRDNRKANLRIVSRLENARNHARPSGVSRRGSKWRAYVWVGGRQQTLGVHPSEQEARDARLAYEREHWGVQPRRVHLHAGG